MLTTVAIPAFNHARYVKQSLDSILCGISGSIEVIIADDASSDATPAVIKSWRAENEHRLNRFVFIERSRGVGLCASLNEIVRAARGDVIHMLASDDFFLEGGLEAKTEAMAANPDWDYVFCDGQAVGPSGEIFAASLLAAGTIDAGRVNCDFAAEELLYNWQPPANLHSWRRSAFKAHGGEFEFDPTVFCEDLDGAWWALSRGKIGLVTQICQAYRHRSWPQTSSRDPSREYRDVAFILAKYAKFFAPEIAEAMRNFSDAFFKSAVGDDKAAEPFWHRHWANRARYLEKVESQ